jgi:hypothetical protein
MASWVVRLNEGDSLSCVQSIMKACGRDPVKGVMRHGCCLPFRVIVLDSVRQSLSMEPVPP